MVEAPELTSITRHRTVRPLVAAWVFVIALLAAGFIWLTLSSNDQPVAEENTPQIAAKQSDNGSDIPLTPNMPSDELAVGNVPELTTDITPSIPLDEAIPPNRNEDMPAEARNSLVKAPIDGLVITGANGPLPVLGPDSMVAWKEYARPVIGGDNFDKADWPKIALIITGIGLNSKSSDLAIKQLPGQIDLGISPYGRGLQNWMDLSRDYGHESFLMLPTEPLKYPENDPGPHTLLTGASPRDNLKKLDWVLSQVTGYVGVINDMGSKFTTSEKDVLPILKDLHGRGLMLLDSRSTRYSVAAKTARRISMPRAVNNLFIDNVITSTEIAQRLTELENTAKTYGAAVGIARAFPLTIQEISQWSRELESRGLHLVPVTAIANRQPVR